MTYYNEFDVNAAAWLRELCNRDLISKGDVDERSILNVKPEDLKPYNRCHFFAGIGGWDYALRLAGWPEDRPVWTASLPCQPFSVAGKKEGMKDERNLWPVFFELVRQCKPECILGEQVEAAIKFGWLDRVFDDLEREGYTCGAVCLPAASVGAPHIRQRLYWVAYSKSERPVRESGEVQSQDGRQESEQCGKFVGAGEIFSGVAFAKSTECERGREARAGRSGLTDDSRVAHRVSQGLQGQRGLIEQHGQEGREGAIGHGSEVGSGVDDSNKYSNRFISGKNRKEDEVSSEHREKICRGEFSGTGREPSGGVADGEYTGLEGGIPRRQDTKRED